MDGFHWLDYTIFVFTVIGSIAIGLYNATVKHSQAGADNYLSVTHELGIFPVTMSMIMSQISSIELLSHPTEIYFYGTQIFILYIAKNLGMLLSCFLFLPMVYQLEIRSVFEYHDLRYGSRLLRKISSVQKTIVLLFWAGACVYAPSVAMAAVTDVPLWGRRGVHRCCGEYLYGSGWFSRCYLD